MGEPSGQAHGQTSKEASLHNLSEQVSQQLTLTEARADALKEAFQQLVAARAEGHAQSEQEQSQETGDMASSVVQGAQQVENFIKDVAALDEVLCEVQSSQEKVKVLLAASKADMSAVVELVRYGFSAEAEQLRSVAANNLNALEQAWRQLTDDHEIGLAFAKRVREEAIPLGAMTFCGPNGTRGVPVPQHGVAVIAKTIYELLDVYKNTEALDEAVRQFIATAQVFLDAHRNHNEAGINGNQGGDGGHNAAPPDM